MANGRDWTDDEDTVLRRLWGEGYDPEAIAERLPGRSREAVRMRAHRLELPSRSGPVWTEEDDAALRRHRAAGLSASQVATEMGRTRNAVLGRMHRTKDGVNPVKPSGTPRSRRIAQADKAAAARRREARKARQAEQVARRQTPPIKALKTRGVGKPVAPLFTEPRRFTHYGVPTTPYEPLSTSTPVRVEDHRDGQCRWPIGDPALFCGCEVAEGRVYCAAHCAIAYTQRVSSGKRPRRATGFNFTSLAHV